MIEVIVDAFAALIIMFSFSDSANSQEERKQSMQVSGSI